MIPTYIVCAIKRRLKNFLGIDSGRDEVRTVNTRSANIARLGATNNFADLSHVIEINATCTVWDEKSGGLLSFNGC